MIAGSYSDPANSTSKYPDLLPGRKCLPGHSLISYTPNIDNITKSMYCEINSKHEINMIDTENTEYISITLFC